MTVLIQTRGKLSMALQNSQLDVGHEASHHHEAVWDPAWANEAPLKLVAAALHAMPSYTGRHGEIKKALEPRVQPVSTWNNWWKRVRPMLDESDHFEERKANQFTVLHEVEDIPPEPLPPPPRKARPPRAKSPTKSQAQWLDWLSGETIAPPKPAPIKATFQALDNYPVASVQKALECASQAAREFLASDRPSKQHAARWGELLSRLSSWWRDHSESHADAGNLARPVGEVLGNLVETAGFPGEAGRWLRQAGGLPSEPPEAWRTGFAAGLWQAFANSSLGARHSFQSCFGRQHQDKPAIAQELLLAAFTDNNSAIHHARLDSLLETLPPEDRSELIQNLVIQSASGKVPIERVQDYVGSTYHIPASSPADGLKPLVLAALLLTDGQSSVVGRASQQIGDILADPSVCVDAPALAGLLSEGRQRIADLRERHTHELENKRQSFKCKLAEHRREEERLNQTVQSLRAEIAAGREVARMDILQDILTVITETLQSLRRHPDCPEQMLRRVEANLTLALRAGGAEEFGKVDDTVPYDPIRHQAEQYVPSGFPVRIAFPGAVIPGKLAGDRVLIKASVVVPAEVN